MSTTITIVKNIIGEQMCIRVEEIKETDDLVHDLGCDSLDQVELLLSFEKAYNREVPDEDAEQLRTVGDIVRYIDTNITSKGAV